VALRASPRKIPAGTTLVALAGRGAQRDGRRFCGARPGGWRTGSGGGSTGGGAKKPAPKPAPTAKQKLATALKQCKRKASGKKRKACEKQAKAKYAPKKSKK